MWKAMRPSPNSAKVLARFNELTSNSTITRVRKMRPLSSQQ
jgi:flagellar motor switch protein FliG